MPEKPFYFEIILRKTVIFRGINRVSTIIVEHTVRGRGEGARRVTHN